MHKAILALRSPVFKRMLESNLAEMTDGRATVAYSRGAVEQLIGYMYAPEVALDSPCTDLELAMEIAEMADYYQIEPLKCHYDAQLAKLVTRDTMCELLLLGDRIKSVESITSSQLCCRLPQVLRAVVNVLHTHAAVVAATDEWMALGVAVRAKAMQAVMTGKAYELINN